VFSVNFYRQYSNLQHNAKIVEKTVLDNKKQELKQEVEIFKKMIQSKQESIENKLKTSIKIRVNQAHEIALNTYNLSKSQKHVIDTLRAIRSPEDNGYFFMTRLDGVELLFADKPEMEGKNLLNLKNQDGMYVIADMIDIVKNHKEGFYTYNWTKPNSNGNQFKKISYIKYFEPLNCFIGTGIYLDDVVKIVQEDVLSTLESLQVGKNKSYIFAGELNGVTLMGPAKGKNMLQVTDANGVKIVQRLISVAKEGGGFVQYVMPNLEGNRESLKISYSTLIPDWNWYIGTGEYIDYINLEAQNEQKKLIDNFKEQISIGLIIILFASIFAWLFLKYIENYFKSDLDEFKIFFEKFPSDEKLMLNRENIRFEEFDSVALFANDMLTKHSEMMKDIQKKDDLINRQSKLASMGEMIGNIAHQWRQPLSLITTVATGLKFKLEMGLFNEKEGITNLDMLNESAQYLSQTIDDFRNFFKPEKEKQTFHLSTSIDTTVSLNSAKLKNHFITLETINHCKDVEVYGFKNELIQALINIINNAIDALNENNTDTKIIIMEIFTQDAKTHINIQDNAGGIPSDIIEHVFEPYFTTKHQSVGTGLGLFMAYEIIIQHFGGMIDVENRSFEYNDKNCFGACFKIII
jgi:signal transduction histidine kinase